ncbi:MAG: glycosyltransferase family 4 protein [bacterium]|nr:glycosyltransferase family 4 protein [bacterium]
MHVGVNTLNLRTRHAGEEFAYLRELLRRLHRLHSELNFVLLTGDDADGFDEWPRVSVSPGSWIRRGPDRLHKVALDAGIQCILSSVECAPGRGPIPTILYSVDIVRHLHDIGDSGRRKTARLKHLGQACFEARAMLAPSRLEKQALLDYVEVPLDKVIVAPWGVDEAFGEPQHCFVQKPYILMTGGTGPATNISRALEAYRRLRPRLPHNLVIVGQSGSEELDDWGDGVMRVDTVPPPQLASLFQHCDLYLCPTFYPGPSLSILQAMRASARIVATRSGTIPEFAGNAPIYFEKESGRSLMEAIVRAVEEPVEEREPITHAAAARASEYTWNACAGQALKVFRYI